MVYRIYVEKRPEYAVEARGILSEIRHLLRIKSVTGLRLLNRYDVEGISEELFSQCCGTVFSEPQLDFTYTAVPEGADAVFATEFLPGQFDQRAASAAECIQLISQGERPDVQSARVFLLYGAPSAEELAEIKKYVINPVEAREASLAEKATLKTDYAIPTTVETLEGFTALDEAGLADFVKHYGLAMDEGDIAFCQSYFKSEHRDPTITEIRMIDTYWSDHCRHTTFGTILDDVQIEDETVKAAWERYLALRREVHAGKNKPVCLMDLGTIGGKYLKKTGVLKNMDESDEINACSVRITVDNNGTDEPWLLLFKNETHNHPTEIEPFGGAATCIGGAIRDPLANRGYVYQAMRVTGAGDPLVPVRDTMPGKLPQRKLVTTAAAGYSSYGNQIGLATGMVDELYHPGYIAKRMEIGAVVGAVPEANVRREQPVPGDVVILLGGRTGRDGCGGATGSSKAHKLESLETCGAEVQKGNAPVERKLQRLFRTKEATRMIKRCNDFGAGGVCVAIGELAPGLLIDLDKVPKKYEGLDGTELAISESQERMAVVLAPGDVDSFKALAARENLDAQSVAVVTEDPRLRMQWRGDRIVDISRAFLDTNGVTQNASALISSPKGPCAMYEVPEVLRGKSGTEALVANMARLEVCGQKGLSERFDSVIGAGTVLMPFGGLYQLTPEEAMVGKIPLLSGETDDATAMGWGYIPRVSRWSPFMGAAYAVVESLSKLAAVGADPLKARLTFQEYFPRLHEDPARWGQPAAALLGALSAQIGMGLPAIGGKDSMSGSFEDLDVPPTLVSFALSMTKASRTLSACVKHPGTQLALIPIPHEENGMPHWPKLKELYRRVLTAIDCGEITAMSVVREGGASAAAMRMCFGNKLGFKFCPGLSPETLYAPMQGAMVAALSPETAVPEGAVLLGRTTGGENVHIDGGKVPMNELIAAWSGTLEKVFPNLAPPAPMPADTPLCTQRSGRSPAIKTAKPRVFIPAFPGTNSEVDSARAFERAGAKAQVLVVRNLTPADIEDTIREMERAIRESQIVMIPGGFSGGDEPEGSGKFIATTFRNPRIAEAVMDLLDNRDGLMLGICNGFQALIKLGLLPYGRITEPSESAPTLTFNSLGRHVSRLVYTRVTSVKSPWLRGAKAGDVHTIAISHGEGRFVANDGALRALIEGGQIATQYVDPEGAVSGDIQWNPNGSVCAVEGITSPDGRILGKMGHNERWTPGLFKNVPGHKDQKLFRSGVEYFA